VIAALRNLLFPAICLACHAEIADQRKLLCPCCAGALVPLDPTSRCLICFSALIDEIRICEGCRLQRPKITRATAPFSDTGPAKELLERFLSGHLILKELLSAYMTFQFLKLDLPYPDRIVPVPESSLRRWERGFSPSELLADRVGQILERPVSKLLGRYSGDFPQRRLSIEKRKALQPSCFFWKKKEDLLGETILLVDDRMGTSATLSACAAVLSEGFAARVYGLTFCIEELF